MTLFERCVEAASGVTGGLGGPFLADDVTRAVLEAIRDGTGSPYTCDEMCRVLGEGDLAGRALLSATANAHLPKTVPTDSMAEMERIDNMLVKVEVAATDVAGDIVGPWKLGETVKVNLSAARSTDDPLPPRIGPDCEPVA